MMLPRGESSKGPVTPKKITASGFRKQSPLTLIRRLADEGRADVAVKLAGKNRPSFDPSKAGPAASSGRTVL